MELFNQTKKTLKGHLQKSGSSAPIQPQSSPVPIQPPAPVESVQAPFVKPDPVRPIGNSNEQDRPPPLIDHEPISIKTENKEEVKDLPRSPLKFQKRIKSENPIDPNKEVIDLCDSPEKKKRSASTSSPSFADLPLSRRDLIKTYQQPPKTSTKKTSRSPSHPSTSPSPSSDSQDDASAPSGSSKRKVIYFATRTHSQVKQLVRELKRSSYRVQMVVLGSREHTCIEPNVSRAANKNLECKNLMDTECGCSYRDRSKYIVNNQQLAPGGSHEVFDIEDLVGIGRTLSACPYYGATGIRKKKAVLVFCPYNYLLDPKIREGMEIDLTDQVVIFDEAHNVEDVCRSVSSFDFDLKDFAELSKGLKVLSTLEYIGSLWAPLYHIVESLLQSFSELAQTLKPEDFEKNANVWKGDTIVNILRDAGVTLETFFNLKNTATLAFVSETPPRYKLTSVPTIAMENLFQFFDFFFSYNLKHAKDYRMVIEKSANFRATQKRWQFTLGLWCLNASVAFNHVATSAKSVILTSGTLSPMNALSAELSTKFPVQVEARHIIDIRKQLYVAAVARGQNVPLNSSFKTADSFAFQDAVGHSLLQYCQKIPKGVLCFFPSYGLMNKLMSRWDRVGILRLIKDVKPTFTEPQSKEKGDFKEIIAGYYDSIKSNRGALFFAVCRGKVSEGLDFADDNARGVIVIGIPFPQIKDLRVALKKDYNTDEVATRPQLLNGNKWYVQQAFSAVNQALGRCIRHINDWGAIILIDERFLHKDNSSQLSKWMREAMQLCTHVEDTIKPLEAFLALH
eukprot:TRINITY_DN2946_c3_g1_i1.p1 TRINITY_DN2946_c3_g1~~TRINITY_DN2946_c3_g1_i1.p1  ORF type:complete len:793 (-),score=221.10 TRINITY_DN2946_c3_g1_i1:92-2470(-)